jgi:hypothetical protein
MASINTALESLKINTGSVVGNVQISVAATVNPVGYFYNGVNGHFYRPISTGATYTNARTLASQQTFKGQQGYLVTITSASEDAFIFANVPQSSIWFALTDEVEEARWTIDAGPEKGTLIKINNGQLNGNIPGQYNNWAPGEPNNSGNEDYAVTKWGGGSQWNDLPNNFSCAYVVEFGTWANPDDATFTEFYTNSVTHSNGDVLRASFNVDFGSNVDETKFTARGYTFTNNNWNVVNGTARQLSGLGKVDLTSLLDTAKVANGVRATTTTGGVEWCVIYDYDVTNQRYRVGIDSREVNGIVSNPSMISSLQLFDLWNGPVTFNSYDSNGWTEVYIYTSTQFNFSGSSFASNIRSGNGFNALTVEFTFSPIMAYKPHGMELTHSNQTELNTLYNSIVTVSDVFLAFKELSDGGIFGNQSGMGLTNGIQYLNADVDGNGVFNESDTYKLLQHLTGVQSLSQSTALTNLMKLYNKSDYDAVTTSNWGTRFNSTRNLIPFTLGGLNNTYNINVTWLGDVNLSHSAQQSVSSVSSNSIRSMSVMSNSITNEVNVIIMSEIVGNSVIVTLSVDPLQQELVGTQFQLNYDNTKLKFEKVEFTTKGNPTNFGTNKGSYINIGSLITSGDVLDKTTEYKVIFTPINSLNDILGLTSISATDAVNKGGKQLKVKVN